MSASQKYEEIVEGKKCQNCIFWYLQGTFYVTKLTVAQCQLVPDLQKKMEGY